MVIVHGGHEHFQLPSLRMVETYRFFVDVGADVVMNHHQHCYSGYEVYKGKPIFYGLGNFCFDNPQLHSGNWTEGYVVILWFKNESVTYKLIPYCQCGDYPNVKLLPQNVFEDQIGKINAIIADNNQLKKEVNCYYESCAGSNSWLFEPIRNTIYYKLRYRGILPSFVSKKKKLSAANKIFCESHCDKMKWWLEH